MTTLAGFGDDALRVGVAAQLAGRCGPGRDGNHHPRNPSGCHVGEPPISAVGIDPTTTKFGTSTTTNLTKVLPRLTRGDGGGCPILVVSICARTV
ncbi:MAG: hypothetical protein M3137_16935 [Actinomycetota bacterium]|nr:hypothetical protein [Actinomycetota bacterium]